MSHTEIVTNKTWPSSLYCTRCGKRIINGHNVTWLGTTAEATCERCSK